MLAGILIGKVILVVSLFTLASSASESTTLWAVLLEAYAIDETNDNESTMRNDFG